MRRFVAVALTAAAIAVPSATVLAVSGSAEGAATHSIACSGLSGTETGTVTVSKCLPAKAGYTSVKGTSTKLATGGTLTWNNGKTTIVGKPKLNLTGKACPKGDTEDTATGSVTGGTAANTKKGDTFSASVCITKTGAISILKNSKVDL
jgi:hypothetical protein